MDYQQTLDYLFSRLPMFSRIGVAAYKKDLTNTIALCAALQNPQQKFKSIHIAGTNGKGSTSHMLAAIFQTAGYKTGLYTSPHLKDFRERIKINGEMIPEDTVIQFTEKIEPWIEKLSPSFFEITVAMAFDYFAKEQVDIAIIETGLGGRLDSTNVLTPELCIITNIGYDHQNLLGNTLKEIAGEKAGIIKNKIPVIIGEIHDETKTVFEEKAKQMHAPIYFAEEHILIDAIQNNWNGLAIQISKPGAQIQESYALDLTGTYQVKNIKAVLLAVTICNQKGFLIEKDVVKIALKTVKKLTGLFGRWEVLERNPTVIADVAHNVDGIKEITAQVVQFKQIFPDAAVHIILGMVKDKEINPVLELLPKDAKYYFTQAAIPRALAKEDLMEKARAYDLKGAVFADVNIALQTAKENAKQEDLILIFGSIFLIGALDY